MRGALMRSTLIVLAGGLPLFWRSLFGQKSDPKAATGPCHSATRWRGWR